MLKTPISLIGMSNGHELVIRYMSVAGILREDVYETVQKQTWFQAVETLEAHDPTVKFVDYVPNVEPHKLSFGADRTTLRVVPTFCPQAAYTVTLDNEDAFVWVRDLIGSSMYHLTAIPA